MESKWARDGARRAGEREMQERVRRSMEGESKIVVDKREGVGSTATKGVGGGDSKLSSSSSGTISTMGDAGIDTVGGGREWTVDVTEDASSFLDCCRMKCFISFDVWFHIFLWLSQNFTFSHGL